VGILASPLCVTYPCTSAPIPQTIGMTTIGATIDSGDSGFLNGSRVVTNGYGGHLVSASVYFEGTLGPIGSRQYQLGLYSDTNGQPGVLLGTSPIGTIQINAWNRRIFALPIALTPHTPYWLLVNNNGPGGLGVQVLVYTDGVGASTYSTSPVAFGVWPTTFQAVVTSATFSIFGTLLP
jgi:hypothetical protein